MGGEAERNWVRIQPLQEPVIGTACESEAYGGAVIEAVRQAFHKYEDDIERKVREGDFGLICHVTFRMIRLCLRNPESEGASRD